MNFSEALEALKRGEFVSRGAWDGTEGARFLNIGQLDWLINKDDMLADDWKTVPSGSEGSTIVEDTPSGD